MKNKSLNPLLKNTLNPFAQFAEFDREFDAMLARMQDLHGDDFRPLIPSNFKESDEAYLYSFDMPGVDESDIKITHDDSNIFITAERKNEFEGGQSLYRYSQSFRLPKNAKTDRIEASYEKGVLSIGVAKESVQAEKTREIPVKKPQEKSSWWNPFN